LTTINISVKLLATHRQYLPPHAEGNVFKTDIPAGLVATDVLKQLDVPLGDDSVVVINGRTLPDDTILQEGDVVCAFPAVGGGCR